MVHASVGWRPQFPECGIPYRYLGHPHNLAGDPCPAPPPTMAPVIQESAGRWPGAFRDLTLAVATLLSCSVQWK